MAHKIIQVPITDLHVRFDVRKRLNDDHVLHLASLIEAGEKLPPILIAWAKEGDPYEIIDGRHRKAALELLGRTHADCTIDGQRGAAESIIIALEKNTGGALPPTKEDIVHSMILLFNEGWKQRKIVEEMPLPKEVTRKYIKDAWGIVLKAKLASAMKAIAENGFSAKEAALKFNVPLEKIQEHLNPNRKKSRISSVAKSRANSTKAYQSFHMKISHVIRAVLQEFEDGEFSEQEVHEFFDNLQRLVDQGNKRINEWRNRFENTLRNTNKLSTIDFDN